MLKKSVSIILAVLIALSVFAIAPFTASAEAEGVDPSFGKTYYEAATYTCNEDGSITMNFCFTSKNFEYMNSDIQSHNNPPYKITFAGLSPEVLNVRRKLTYYDYHINAEREWNHEIPVNFSLSIPSSVKEIGDSSFYGFGVVNNKNSNSGAIWNVRMGINVKKIGKKAFMNCAFNKIMLPETLEEIGEQAFARSGSNRKLSNVYIPSNVKILRVNAFEGNTSLTIWGVKGSFAETYAKDHSLKFESAYDFTDLPDGTVRIDKCNIPESVFSDLIDIPKSINGKTVSEIGDYAFNKQKIRKGVLSEGEVQHDSIVIPETIKKIGKDALPWVYQNVVVNAKSDAQFASSAFDNCMSVTLNITDNKDIPETAFKFHKHITNVNISEGIENIGKEAFSYAEKLETVSFPDSLKTIGKEAFYQCSELGKDAGVVIPKNVVSIGEDAFLGCIGMKSLTLPDGLKEIGSGAFSYCTSLTELIVPESVTSIGQGAFDHMGGDFMLYVKPGSYAEEYAKKNDIRYNSKIFKYALFSDGDDFIALTGYVYEPTEPTFLEIPTEFFYRTVSRINRGTFSNIDALTGVKFPASVIYIENGAFGACKNLTAFEVDPENAKFCSVDGVVYNKDKTELVLYPSGKKDASFTVPDSVENIRKYAFYGCENLKEINISKNVKQIGDEAIRYCKSITAINVEEGNPAYRSINGVLYSEDNKRLIKYPSGSADAIFSVAGSIEQLPKAAFEDCRNLKVLSVPKTVTTIGTSAISGFSKDFVMSVEKSSEAEKYARNTGIKYVYPELQTGKLGDFEWSFDSTSGVFTAKGPGKLEPDESLSAILNKTKIFVAGDGVTAIGDMVCAMSDDLLSVSLADSVTEVGDLSFASCPNLRSISLGKGFEKLGESVFCGGSLNIITVSEDNVYYKTVNGLLMTADGKKVILCPTGKTDEVINVPDGVEELCSTSFAGCAYLKKIVLPDTVKIIGESAFSKCSALEDVRLP